uniref:Delta-6-fatty acid desaturase n=1 Tax=Anemone leveillei TaxID=212809 RepID=Q71BG5_ANELE|nr:delta-6-fatty acid desaturase [Anemone leveillei]
MAEKRRSISSDDLRSHNKPGDVWISIQGKIYDVTEWGKDHPGGEGPLLNLAGQDVTDAFVAFHPGSAWKNLDKFHIGYLQDYVVSDVSKDYRKLVSEFSKAGLYEKKGHGHLIRLLVMSLVFIASVSGVVLSDKTSVHVGSAVLLAVIWMQFGFIGHDSGHYNIMTSPELNRYMQIFSVNVVSGVSVGWWKRYHNAHHIAVNSLEYDPDLQYVPFLVVSTAIFDSLTSHFYRKKMTFDAVARFLVSFQHWTFYPLMAIGRVSFLAQSIGVLLSKKPLPDRHLEWFGLVVFWAWYSLLISCLPNWWERVIFIAVNFAVTGIQHVQFCLNHYSAQTYIGAPCANDWFEKQTKGSIDISCSPWTDWFHGGLQFQIEHHLFPRMPRCNLRKISPFVKELCRKHNLVYTSVSFFEGNRRTLATLKNAALKARDLTSPIPKNLVWEAVHTHG